MTHEDIQHIKAQQAAAVWRFALTEIAAMEERLLAAIRDVERRLTRINRRITAAAAAKKAANRPQRKATKPAASKKRRKR
jgi:hypothetical protein